MPRRSGRAPALSKSLFLYKVTLLIDNFLSLLCSLLFPDVILYRKSFLLTLLLAPHWQTSHRLGNWDSEKLRCLLQVQNQVCGRIMIKYYTTTRQLLRGLIHVDCSVCLLWVSECLPGPQYQLNHDAGIGIIGMWHHSVCAYAMEYVIYMSLSQWNGLGNVLAL